MTACAISCPSSAPARRGSVGLSRRDGAALAQPGDGARRPLQDLLELCSRALARPAPALLEGDQGAGVDDPVGSEAALADVEFSPARGGGRPGADHSRVDDVRRLSGRLRVCHSGDSSLSGVLRRCRNSNQRRPDRYDLATHFARSICGRATTRFLGELYQCYGITRVAIRAHYRW